MEMGFGSGVICRRRRSKRVHVNDCLGELTGSFLRQVVSDTTPEKPMFVWARKPLGVRCRLRMRRAVRVALESDGGHVNDGSARQPRFQVVESRLSLGQAEPPAVIVDHDIDMVRVVECGGTSVERRGAEIPFGGGGLPDQSGKVLAIFVVPGPAPVRGEVELIPSREFRLGRQWGLVRLQVADC